jgi:hypothetical protein
MTYVILTAGAVFMSVIQVLNLLFAPPHKCLKKQCDKRVRDSFPLHYTVFKQYPSHPPHEARVEQLFSRSGNLSDPNMDPEFLATLTSIAG